FIANAKHGWTYARGPNHPESISRYPVEIYNFKHAAYFNFRLFGPFRWPIYNMLTRLLGPDGPLIVPRPRFYLQPTLTLLFVINTLAGMFGIIFGLRLLQRRMREAAAHPDAQVSTGASILPQDEPASSVVG